MNLEIAKTIKHQIGINTHMACGSRDFIIGHDYFSFRVGSNRKKQFIKIKLNAKDLYDIEYLTLNQRTFELSTEELFEDIYGDMLSEMVYRMVNK